MARKRRRRHWPRGWKPVYRENVRLARSLRLTVHAPASKLEVVFLRSYSEFNALLSQATDDDAEILGYYDPAAERSVFFDLHTYPPIITLQECVRAKAGEDRTVRRELELKLQRSLQRLQRRVVQHEAAHQVHQLIGLLPPDDAAPPWLREGLAQLFELPFVESGATLELWTNRERLNEFLRTRDDAESLAGTLRRLVADRGTLREQDYAASWALVDYLYMRERRELGAYLRELAAPECTGAGERKDKTAFEARFGAPDEALANRLRVYVGRLANRLHIGTDRRPSPSNSPP